MKLFRLFAGKEKEEVTELPSTKRTQRIGMDKNFRVGRVKHVSADRSHLLIGVIEMCNGDGGEPYEASYNIWLRFDHEEWKHTVSKNLVGSYVVFGFYIQSFRVKDMSDTFETVLSCRFLNQLPDERTAKSLSIDLMESRLFVEHDYLKLSNIKIRKQEVQLNNN